MDINIIEELQLQPYKWSTFSFVDVMKYKLHVILNWLACRVFGFHDWSVIITSWEISEISTLQQFQRNQANKLKCSCCGLVELYDVDMVDTFSQMKYECRTRQYFLYGH
jgi:predicted nucleic-acid-binding Zn-ribbon protein